MKIMKNNKKVKFNIKCFFGFHEWLARFPGSWDLKGSTRVCLKCRGVQKEYKCGASDTWRWEWIVSGEGSNNDSSYHRFIL